LRVDVTDEYGYRLPGCLVSIYDGGGKLLDQGYTGCQGSVCLEIGYGIANWKVQISPPAGFEPMAAHSDHGQVVNPATIIYSGWPSGFFHSWFSLRNVGAWLSGVSVYDAAVDELLPGIWVSLFGREGGDWELGERKQTDAEGCVYFNSTDLGGSQATWEIRVEVPEDFQAVEAVPVDLGPLAPRPTVIDAATLRFTGFNPGCYSGNSFILRSTNFWVIEGEVYQICSVLDPWKDVRPVVRIYGYDGGWKLKEQRETDQFGHYRFVFRDLGEGEATSLVTLVAPVSKDPLMTYQPIKAWSGSGGEVIDAQTIRYTKMPCCRRYEQEFAMLYHIAETGNASAYYYCVGAQAIDPAGKGLEGVDVKLCCDAIDLRMKTGRHGWVAFFGARGKKHPPTTCELIQTSVPNGYVPIHAWSDCGGTAPNPQTIWIGPLLDGIWVENYFVLEERE